MAAIINQICLTPLRLATWHSPAWAPPSFFFTLSTWLVLSKSPTPLAHNSLASSQGPSLSPFIQQNKLSNHNSRLPYGSGGTGPGPQQKFKTTRSDQPDILSSSQNPRF
ncbi:uncharacterized protein BDV17DRAFT_23822 [Aspergillus undulatus]|uniref:uncharacterized protein n=1 Tax=Aspergillus undulatus TaxID=1810928 RepID=UPI003CCDF5FB